ncbi:MAG: DUF6879 family protein [Pseudonocardiaceae bacterium]
MHLYTVGLVLGGEVITDPATIVQHNYWRDVAWHHAVPRNKFASE